MMMQSDLAPLPCPPFLCPLPFLPPKGYDSSYDSVPATCINSLSICRQRRTHARPFRLTHAQQTWVCVCVCKPLPTATCPLVSWRCAQVANGNFQPLRRGLCPLCLNFKPFGARPSPTYCRLLPPPPAPPLSFGYCQHFWPRTWQRSHSSCVFTAQCENPKPSRECEYTHCECIHPVFWICLPPL